MQQAPKLLRGCSPEIILALAARRILAAARDHNRTVAQVPSLGPLAPLASQAMSIPKDDERAFFETFNTLANLFGLDVIAADLLLLSLATELDERIYSAALNLTGTLFGAPGPRIGSWLAFLYPQATERSKAMGALLNNGPLTRYKLVRILGNANAPLSQREICGEPALIGHVLPGSAPEVPEELIGLAQLVYPARERTAIDRELLGTELAQRIQYELRSREPQHLLYIHPVASRSAPPLARLIASEVSRPVIVLDMKAVERDMESVVAITMREARLRYGLVMFVDPMNASEGEENYQQLKSLAQRWRRALALENELVMFVGDIHEANHIHALEQVGVHVAVQQLQTVGLDHRRKLFRTELAEATKNGKGVGIDGAVSVEQLASVYRVGIGDVEAIVHHAVESARLRAAANNVPALVEPDDLWRAARERTRRHLGGLARRIECRYSWEDLILPIDTTRLLFDFYTAALNRARVYEDWGFSRKHMRGRGLSALFSGESGTGKTMAAEVIANSLNVDLYQVELSSVVSKWVGETERNLKQLFDATEGSDSVLFFDEADALFGKRTEVKESKDRYANMEVSFLLQRIEQYDGIVILASNLRSHIDTAFMRRFQFGIPFPKPDELARLAIWQQVYPAEVPLDGLDLEGLATKYDTLTGGQIRMVAVGAALLAARHNSPITMRHIERSYQNELQKLNRVVMVNASDASDSIDFS